MKKLFIIVMCSLLFVSCGDFGGIGEYKIEEKPVVSNNGTFLIVSVYGCQNIAETDVIKLIITKYPNSVISKVSKALLPYEFYVVTPNK